jgi:hypothetical protein
VPDAGVPDAGVLIAGVPDAAAPGEPDSVVAWVAGMAAVFLRDIVVIGAFTLNV